MYIRGCVDRGGIDVIAGSVGIHGLKIQVEPVREVCDKMKRETLGSNMLLELNDVEKREAYVVNME